MKWMSYLGCLKKNKSLNLVSFDEQSYLLDAWKRILPSWSGLDVSNTWHVIWKPDTLKWCNDHVMMHAMLNAKFAMTNLLSFCTKPDSCLQQYGNLFTQSQSSCLFIRISNFKLYQCFSWLRLHVLLFLHILDDLPQIISVFLLSDWLVETLSLKLNLCLWKSNEHFHTCMVSRMFIHILKFMTKFNTSNKPINNNIYRIIRKRIKEINQLDSIFLEQDSYKRKEFKIQFTFKNRFI